MAYTVKIVYNGVAADAARFAAPISRCIHRTGSYIDTPVFTQGYPVDAEEADKRYGKSVYATNVAGYGELDVKAPYDATSIPFPVPMAQFNLAAISETGEVTFEVEDYKEAFYYMTIGKDLADQGFEVTVTEAEAATQTAVMAATKTETTNAVK